jgi:hypothetical protein
MKRIAIAVFIVASLLAASLYYAHRYIHRDFYEFKSPKVVVIDRTKLDHITIGMRQNEVEKLLGLKAGDYTSGEYYGSNPPLLLIRKDDRLIPNSSDIKWIDDATSLYIVFDDAGELIHAAAWTNRLK